MTDSALDTAIFNELKELMEEAMADFITTYLENTPNLINEIAKAQETNDYETIFLSAHQLKGGSGSMGALKLADIARHIEAAAKQSDNTNLQDLVNQLQDEYTRLESELNTISAQF